MSIISYSTELKIASGFDNTAGYSLITDLTDSDSIPYTLPSPYAGAIRGIVKPTLSRRVIFNSSAVYKWTFPYMTIKQLEKLYDDYYNSNASAVTVRTVQIDGTVADLNAYISVPLQIDVMANNTAGIGAIRPGNYVSNYIQDVVVGFSIVGTAT